MREPIAEPNTTKYSEVEITGEAMLCIRVRAGAGHFEAIDGANRMQVHWLSPAAGCVGIRAARVAVVDQVDKDFFQ